MNAADLIIPEMADAKIDTTKNRAEIILNGDNGQSIIAYFPMESLQVYVYKIDGCKLPDMWNTGIRTEFSGEYLRTLICKHGHGEFSEDGVNLNLSGGEFALIYGTKTDNRFLFSADSLIGIEIILLMNEVVNESILLRMLQSALRDLGLFAD